MLTESEKLCAISRWSRETGLSYGKLVNDCSQSELDKIYGEYDNLLQKRQQAEDNWVALARKLQVAR